MVVWKSIARTAVGKKLCQETPPARLLKAVSKAGWLLVWCPAKSKFAAKRDRRRVLFLALPAGRELSITLKKRKPCVHPLTAVAPNVNSRRATLWAGVPGVFDEIPDPDVFINNDFSICQAAVSLLSRSSDFAVSNWLQFALTQLIQLVPIMTLGKPKRGRETASETRLADHPTIHRSTSIYSPRLLFILSSF